MPDDIKISALTNVNTLSDTAVFPMVQDLNGTDTTLKASMSQVAGKVAEGTTFVNLTTTAKDLVGAINEAASTGGSVDITTEIDTPAPIMTFNDGGDNIPLKSLVTEIVPIQAGLGVPSPLNVRAISGHNSVNVFNSGKNLIFTLYQSSSQLILINATAIYTGTLKKGTYTFSATISHACSLNYRKSAGDSSVNIATFLTTGDVSVTFTLAEDLYNCNFFLYSSQGISVSDITNPQLELNDEATAYEAYKGSNTTIPLGQTVYGGSLECVEGNLNLTIDRVMFEYDGSEDEAWQKVSGTGKFYIVNTDMTLYEIEGKISNVYPFSGNTTSSASVTVDKSFYTQTNFDTPNYNRVWVYNSDYENYSNVQFREVLSNQPITILAFLVTPIHITISGVNIPTLSGVNNVYTDCGDIQSLEYFNENGDDIASMVRLMSKNYREVLLPKRVTASVSTITSSSHDGNYFDWCAFNGRTPSNLRNPDAYTCWSAAQNEVNAWIAVDLGSAKDLYEVQLDIFSNYSADWVGNIAIQGSNDNTNWTSILASGNANIGIVAPLQQITSTIIQVSGSYRYVRIVGIDKFTVYYNPSCFFDEIFIYAKE